MSVNDYHQTFTLYERYALWEGIFNTTTSYPQMTLAKRYLGEIKEQSQALWDVITTTDMSRESTRRLAEAEESGILRALNELRNLDLDSIELRLPDTETFEQRGVHA